MMRNTVRTLHLSIALVAAVFVVMLGVTGSIMAFEPELDHVLHRDLWQVAPQGTAALPRRSRCENHGALSRRTGHGLRGCRRRRTSRRACRCPARRSSSILTPATLIGLGASTPDILARIHQLHLRLLWMSHPDAGKKIVGWMDVAMLFLVLRVSTSGGRSSDSRSRGTLRARRRWLDVHAVTGIGVFVFLLLLGLTGAAIAFDGAEDWRTASRDRPRPRGRRTS